MLTGGGDCPGLNAVIRAVSRRRADAGRRGRSASSRAGRASSRASSSRSARARSPGSSRVAARSSRTSRTNPYKVEGGVERVLANFERERFDALVAIGGEDTLGVAARLYEEHGFPVVGVPKTIDNDLSATDYTFGFDTAVCDRDRGDRPAAHHGRVAQPRHGRRGDGPAHRLDRRHERDRRRRRRDPDPRAAGLDRATPARSFAAATSAARTSRSSSSRRATSSKGMPRERRRRPVRSRHGCPSAASAPRWRARSRRAPATRRG